MSKIDLDEEDTPEVIRALRGSNMPRHQTVIDGCVVHGDAPMSDASKAAMREVIAAVKAKLQT